MPQSRSSDSQREMLSLVTARVRDAYVRKPFYVDGALDLVSLCRQLSAQGLTSALVRDGRASRRGWASSPPPTCATPCCAPQPPAALAVREVVRFDLIEIDADADLFEALWLMVRHRVHRLLVRDGEAVLGVLGQLDLVSFVANHSHIVALQIDDAATVSRAEGRGRAHRRDGLAAARRRHQDRAHRTPGRRAQPPPVRPPVGPRRTGRPGGQQLPAGDGQRGPRRADHQDRPGQRAAAARRLRDASATARCRGALQRRAGRVRLPALPRQHHAHQPAVAQQRVRLSRDAARLDLRQRPAEPDAPGDLLRRRGRGRRRPPARRRVRSTSTASWPAATRSWRALRRRPTSSTNRRAGGRASPRAATNSRWT